MNTLRQFLLRGKLTTNSPAQILAIGSLWFQRQGQQPFKGDYDNAVMRDPAGGLGALSWYDGFTAAERDLCESRQTRWKLTFRKPLTRSKPSS